MAWMIADDKAKQDCAHGVNKVDVASVVDTKVAYLAGLLHSVVGDATEPLTARVAELKELLVQDANLTQMQIAAVMTVAQSVGINKMQQRKDAAQAEAARRHGVVANGPMSPQLATAVAATATILLKQSISALPLEFPCVQDAELLDAMGAVGVCVPLSSAFMCCVCVLTNIFVASRAGQ